MYSDVLKEAYNCAVKLMTCLRLPKMDPIP